MLLSAVLGLNQARGKHWNLLAKVTAFAAKRVRQIEKSSLNKIKKNTVVYKDVCKEFNRYLKMQGVLKKKILF